MIKTHTINSSDQLVYQVQNLTADKLQKIDPNQQYGIDISKLVPGKMLRTLLAARLLEHQCAQIELDILFKLCAATEIVHSASLCHDDVIDNATLRRSQPTLWHSIGSTGAILIGDLLLCESINLLADINHGQFIKPFMSKVTQVIKSETEQELKFFSQKNDEKTCLQLARGKTGALFAFIADVCGGNDKAYANILEEVGYRLGTAYQLADDLLDLVGQEESAGKTLRTDSIRGTITLPQTCREGLQLTRRHFSDLCNSALAILIDYPNAQKAVKQYINIDLRQALQTHDDLFLEFTV